MRGEQDISPLYAVIPHERSHATALYDIVRPHTRATRSTRGDRRELPHPWLPRELPRWLRSLPRLDVGHLEAG